jgi:hypothetical protein
MLEAIGAKEMEPALPVITHVDVGTGYYFGLLASLKINLSEVRSLVVSSNKLWALVACLSSSVVSVQGSSMAVLVTTDGIIIASDGILTSVTNGVSTFSRFCKIRQEGNTFYGAVGDYGIPGTKGDVWAMARKAVKSKTMLGIYDLIEPDMFENLPQIAIRNKVAAPKT